jgi:phage tail sheath protein FI
MAVQTTYPGVYIDEFSLAAPIEGIGTSTAAFLGVTASGPINVPTKVTSWDQFRATFGEHPVPGFFLWCAVRGFFQNGGQVCYVVRVSNGAPEAIELEDGAGPPGRPVLRLRARHPGNAVPNIQATVAAVHRLPSGTTSVFQPTTTLAGAPIGREVTVAPSAGGRFRPGDWITIAAAGERMRVLNVNGDTLRLETLSGSYGGGDALRLADATAGLREIRISSSVPIPTGALGAGTMLTVKQGANQDTQIVESVQTEQLGGGAITYRVFLRRGLTIPMSLDPVNPATVQSEEFSITIKQGVGSKTYANLSLEQMSPAFVVDVINQDSSGLVNAELVEPPPPTAMPLNLPVNPAAPTLTGGVDEQVTTIGAAEFIVALDTLRQVDDVNLIAVPDCLNLKPITQIATVQQAVITHCELLADRFAVLDARPNLNLFKGAVADASIEEQRAQLDSTRGYAALYYPWLRVPAAGGGLGLVPPSGHVCGIIARSDISRGVHKAPANELVNEALGVERTMSDIDQGQLNIAGINVLRTFAAGGRVTLWGARTTATDRSWQYVSTRRLFLYLEESIADGIRWAVFEPNNLGLWRRLKRSITEFLTRAWRDGALFGATAEEAFYVRIDEVLNPFSEQALGRLHIEIGLKPTYPAEFVVVHIGIWAGGQEVGES